MQNVILLMVIIIHLNILNPLWNVVDISVEESFRCWRLQPDDYQEGLDSSAAHVANLLSTEPAEIKLGVGGFSMGAAISLYSATCCVYGKYSNGDPYPVNISAAVGLSG